MEEHLKTYNILNNDEIRELSSSGIYKSFKKGDFLIKAGEVSKHLGFIHSGVFRTYYDTIEGNDTTYCLSFPNTFITAYSSYLAKEKSHLYIQALTDAELFVISKEALEHLTKKNMKWILFFKMITDTYYIALENRVFELQRENAETRYRNLMNNHPEYIQKVPLQYIASYLGITQRHLSRLRAEIQF
ncbi:MAG TPA: Crp/Fnr family transcriptional regulator [Cytophagales bacterium]|nr:Crp/Fnr family transcriptional regulator [Cytophagales bacterium]